MRNLKWKRLECERAGRGVELLEKKIKGLTIEKILLHANYKRKKTGTTRKKKGEKKIVLEEQTQEKRKKQRKEENRISAGDPSSGKGFQGLGLTRRI